MAKGEPELRFLPIGQITAAHGIRGEVKVALLTDYPERFRPGARVYLGGEIDAHPAEIAAARPHKQAVLVKFVGVPDRNAAQRMVGQLVLIPNEDRMPLAEGENYAHELLGLRVESTAGRALGEITDILSTGANDVYVVTAPDREVLIPALRDVVLTVDLTDGKMVVELPEGLLD
jgi:16S rRNA processing protein RimM